MEKIMIQLEILSKYIMVDSTRGVNIVGVWCANSDESKFHALYNEKVNLKANKGVHHCSNYPRQGGKQALNKYE